MSSLVPRRPAHAIQSDQRLNAEIADAERPGLTAAARIHAGAFATSVAMHHAVVLSRAADSAFRASPMSEDLYRSILLAYGTFATSEITRLAFHDGGQR
jgi:hypothetical protein